VRIRPVLSGICGSDLTTVAGRSSIYLSAFTSFPFVPGHEVVGNVVETGAAVDRLKVGDRVVLEPALGCSVRGIADPCYPCLEGHYANCERITQGDVSSGVQIGYCRDTGGGWGSELVAHDSQLHLVPDGVTNEAAVLTEPLSCALHGVLEARIPEGTRVLVVGSGTIGLLTIAALRAQEPTCNVVAVAKYDHQRQLASALGADHVVAPGAGGYEQLAQLSGGTSYSLPMGKPAVLGGFDVTFECTGSAGGVEDAIRWTRSQGQLVMTGMPGVGKIDLTPMWYQELRVNGAYAYSLETTGETNGTAKVKTFGLALDMLSKDNWGDRLAALVRHKFRLKQHRKAMAAATRPGRSGAVKAVFDFSQETASG
jgi:threonine dehydrogenase-like Zn-dependent dehydrogenase